MLRHITTPSLHIAYEELGPEGGRPVVMCHGFPDDARTWDQSGAALAAQGFRVLMPYQRGFGETRLRPLHRKAGQYSVLAQDLIDFADALQLPRFLLAGHDWGAAASYMAACLWPERVQGLVTMSVGYEGGQTQPLPHPQKHAYWYQWLFNFKKGKQILDKERKDFCGYLWRVWSPDWHFDDATLAATAASWANPDFVPVVIHSYRHRWQNARGTLHGQRLMKRVQKAPTIRVPTIVLHGQNDGASLADSSAGKEHFFAGRYERRVLPGIGHFIPREAPEAIVRAVEELAG